MLYIAIYLITVPAIASGAVQTPSAQLAGTGAIVFIYFSGFGWAMGWDSIQHLIGAEIFPLTVRSLRMWLAICFYLINQYGNSKAVPLISLNNAPGIKPQGTLWFFSAATLLGLAYVWFFMPEIAGKSLEEMDKIFSLPWWIIGRKAAKLTEGKGSVAEALRIGDLEKTANIQQVEHVDAKRRVS